MKTIEFVKKSIADTILEIEHKFNEKKLPYVEVKTLVKSAKEFASVLNPSLNVEQRMKHSDFLNATLEKLCKIEIDLQISIANSLSKKDYKAHFALSNTYKDVVELKKQLYVPIVFETGGWSKCNLVSLL
ncbi:hypothetical protein [Bacillus safensis]|uniref:hypothetical protein n=1 Tax=Bacillus safensis TaxID=561879 RepID=UPI0020CB7043|nr:hypothetical protein [Bacillus safensis]MCP9283635.1 hypothetical protein [Bacillus safensis]